jgi:hypothetical protein
MRRLLMRVALLAVTGCAAADSAGTQPQPPVLAGTYILQSINGKALPAPQGNKMITSETFVIAASGAYADTLRRSGDINVDAGTVAQTGTTIAVSSVMLSSIKYGGAWDGNAVLTLYPDGNTWVYHK